MAAVRDDADGMTCINRPVVHPRRALDYLYAKDLGPQSCHGSPGAMVEAFEGVGP